MGLCNVRNENLEKSVESKYYHHYVKKNWWITKIRMVRIGLYAELSSFSYKLNLFMKNILLFFLILLNLGYIPFADLSIYKNPDTFLHNAALLFCIYFTCLSKNLRLLPSKFIFTVHYYASCIEGHFTNRLPDGGLDWPKNWQRVM